MPIDRLTAATARRIVTAASVTMRGDASVHASCSANWKRDDLLRVLAQ